MTIPEDVPATIIHGLEDSVVDTPAVVGLCTRSKSSRLILVHDDHPLSKNQHLISAVVGSARAGQNILDP